jgi:hypothetical protein
MGRIIPYIMENNPNVWNHQADGIHMSIQKDVDALKMAGNFPHLC